MHGKPLLTAFVLMACTFGQAAEALAAKCNAMRPGGVFAADRLVDQIGVNVHVGFFDTPYGDFEGRLKPALAELGVRHLRDVAVTDLNKNKTYLDRLADLGAAGYRFSLVAHDKTQPAYEVDPKRLGLLQKRLRGAITMIEGTNEPNLKPVPDWVGTTRASQKALYDAVKADPALAGVTVAGPSPWGPHAPDIGDISASVDIGNWHTYSGGQYPEWYGSSSLPDYLRQARALYGDKPIVVTEDGYHSGMEVPERKHRPTPEDVVERYLPRLIMAHLSCGVVRTYLYEMIDRRTLGLADDESNFGLVRGNGERKASFQALKSLIRLFADPGPVFTPELVPYTVETKSSKISAVEFRKRDGTVLIAAWLGVSAWDPASRKPIDVTPMTARIRIPSLGDTRGTLVAFTPGGATERRDLAPVEPGLYEVTLTDRLSVLQFARPD